MATISIDSLLSFFLEEKKSIKKGENHFKSDHIEAFTYQQGVCLLYTSDAADE